MILQPVRHFIGSELMDLTIYLEYLCDRIHVLSVPLRMCVSNSQRTYCRRKLIIYIKKRIKISEDW